MAHVGAVQVKIHDIRVGRSQERRMIIVQNCSGPAEPIGCDVGEFSLRPR